MSHFNQANAFTGEEGMNFDNERFSGCRFKWREGTLYPVDNRGTFAGPLQSLCSHNRSHLPKKLCQWQRFRTALISLNQTTTVGSAMDILIWEITKPSVASEISFSCCRLGFFLPLLFAGSGRFCRHSGCTLLVPAGLKQRRPACSDVA